MYPGRVKANHCFLKYQEFSPLQLMGATDRKLVPYSVKKQCIYRKNKTYNVTQRNTTKQSKPNNLLFGTAV